jgi:hypothetical protein
MNENCKSTKEKLYEVYFELYGVIILFLVIFGVVATISSRMFQYPNSAILIICGVFSFATVLFMIISIIVPRG